MVGSAPLDPIDMIIGNMALQQKLVDDGQLAEARMMQGMHPGKTLAQILYALGYLSIQQAEKLEHAATVLRVREEDKMLCEVAVKRKMITQAQADEVLQVQKNAAANPGPLPRVKELLINREYVPASMVDILSDLVRQVSPYEKKEAPPPPPPMPPPKPVEKKPDTQKFEKPPMHVGPAGAKQVEPPKPEERPKATGLRLPADQLLMKASGKGLPAASPGGETKQTDSKGEMRSFPPGGKPPATPVPTDRKDSTAPRVMERHLPGPLPSLPPSDPNARLAHGRMFTDAVHAGRSAEAHPTIDPIHPSVTYDFASMEALEEFLKGKPGFWYSRHGNPTVRAAEEKIAALEGAEDAVIASSGLGALMAAIMTLLRPGDTIATTDGLYGGTWHIFNEILPEWNMGIRKVPAKDWLLIREHVAGTTKMIYFEPVTNPMLRIWDPRPPVKDAKRLGILTMVDNTFATPFNLRPIEHGVDLVLHSATKYLGGHSDLTAGVVSGRKDLIARIRERLKLFGATLSAFDAWLLLRGLKTFPLRMRAHNENGFAVAQAIEKMAPKVKKVWYPGLPSHPDHASAREFLRGFGGIVTFEVDGGFAGAKAFANRLQLCHRAVSLGGVETLVSLPVLSSHWQIPDKELERAGILPGCVRLSVGVEDPEDIIRDVEQALA